MQTTNGFKRMYISLISTLGLVLINTTLSKAQAPEWQINPGSFQFSMTVIATLHAPDYPLISESDLVGVFANGELRGFAQPAVYLSNIDVYAAFITVFSNDPAGELMTFQMYDSNVGQLHRAAYAVTFEDGKQVGSIQEPMAIETARLTISPIEDKIETDDPFTVTISTNVNAELPQELILEKRSGPIAIAQGDVAGEFVISISGAGEVEMTAILRSTSLYDGALEELTFSIAEKEPEVVGLEDKSEGLEVYPNPASSFLRVSLPEAQNAHASIVGLDGRALRIFELINGHAMVQISNLRSGLYVLLIQDIDNDYFASKNFMVK